MLKLICAVLLLQTVSLAKTTIASGGITGHYYTLAHHLCEEIAKDGMECEVMATSGSVENIKLLTENKVSYAIVQHGLHQQPIVRDLGKEQFFLFYKNIPKPHSLKELINSVGSEYSFDKKSGTYKTFYQLSQIFGFKIKGKQKKITNKHTTFASRPTKLSIYHISKKSYLFQEMMATGIEYYVFNDKEQQILRKKGFTVKDGMIETQIDLI